MRVPRDPVVQELPLGIDERAQVVERERHERDAAQAVAVAATT